MLTKEVCGVNFLIRRKKLCRSEQLQVRTVAGRRLDVNEAQEEITQNAD